MEAMLGVSVAQASVQMVLVEGENAGAALDEAEVFEFAETAEPTGVIDQVISAIQGTREGAADAGLELSSIGVTWTDDVEAAMLRDAVTGYDLENVMLVSPFLAATAFAQSAGGAMGYDRTAVLFVERETATLAVVETSANSVTEVCKRRIDAESSGEGIAQLAGMVRGIEDFESAPSGVLVIGSGVDVGPMKPALEAATSLMVSTPEEPETALARGAGLASANAPLFASPTQALAYAQDPGTGAIDTYALPEYLTLATTSAHAKVGTGDLAYSAVSNDALNPETPHEDERRRTRLVLVAAGMAAFVIAAVASVAWSVGIHTSVHAHPSPDRSRNVPAEHAPASPPGAARPPKSGTTPGPAASGPAASRPVALGPGASPAGPSAPPMAASPPAPPVAADSPPPPGIGVPFPVGLPWPGFYDWWLPDLPYFPDRPSPPHHHDHDGGETISGNGNTVSGGGGPRPGGTTDSPVNGGESGGGASTGGGTVSGGPTGGGAVAAGGPAGAGPALGGGSGGGAPVAAGGGPVAAGGPAGAGPGPGGGASLPAGGPVAGGGPFGRGGPGGGSFGGGSPGHGGSFGGGGGFHGGGGFGGGSHR
jgi:hypothetical protein